MKRGTLELLGAVAIAVTCMVAGASGQSAALSGNWTGTVVADDSSGDRFNLFFTLNFEGSRVSGTAGTTADRHNGTIATGSFDGSTGALKLEIDVNDGDRIGRAVFDGRVVDDTALGTFTFDDRAGRFLLKRRAGVSPAQGAPGGMDPAAAARQGFAEVSGWLLRAAEVVPPDKYSYKPAPTVRSFGEMLGHVADGYNYYCGRATGQQVEWSDAVANGKTDKGTIVAALKASTSACTAAHDGKGAASPLLLQNFGHANLHYGNIVTYMRMLGLVPPST